MESFLEGLKQKPKFRDGDSIHFLGQPIRISIIRYLENTAEYNGLNQNHSDIQKKNQCRIEIVTETENGVEQKVMQIYWPESLGTPKPTLIRSILVEWYKSHARAIIKERVEVWSQQMQLSYNRIFIKGQKTRWGSCSSLKNLNFNWRLVIAPLPVLDYVVVHELAHLVEMNHSAKFWGMVGTFFPEYRECKDWLKRNGMTLFYFG